MNRTVFLWRKAPRHVEECHETVTFPIPLMCRDHLHEVLYDIMNLEKTMLGNIQIYEAIALEGGATNGIFFCSMAKFVKRYSVDEARRREECTGTFSKCMGADHSVTYTMVNGVLHCDDGPAEIRKMRGDDGVNVTRIIYRHNGLIHRSDGPAIQVVETDTGIIRKEEYYLRGKRHRPHDLPALVDKVSKRFEWHVHGKNVRHGGLPAVIDFKMLGEMHPDEATELCQPYPRVRRSERLRNAKRD